MAKTVVKGLGMNCLEALQHLLENRSLTFQDEECKIIAVVALKQLRATEDCGFANTCLALIQHLFIETRLVTIQLPEFNIIAVAALKQLRATENYGSTNICLSLLQHLLIEEGSVAFQLPEWTTIAEAALKQLGATEDYGLVKTCLALIENVVQKWKKEIQILVNLRLIEEVVSLLQTQLRGQGDDDQVLHTVTVAWKVIAPALDDDIAGEGNARRNRQTFVSQGAVMLIQEHLQRFPDKNDLRISLVKSLSSLAFDGDTASQLMTTEWVTTLLGLLNPTMEAHLPVRYWAASAIVYLAWRFDEPQGYSCWTVQQPSRTQAMEAVTAAIAGWSLTEDPPQEYTSFEDPLWRLAQGPSRWPACWLHHEAWSMANATTHNGEHYCPLLEKEHRYNGSRLIREGTGLEVLQAIIASSSYSDGTKKLAKTALKCYEDYKKTQ